MSSELRRGGRPWLMDVIASVRQWGLSWWLGRQSICLQCGRPGFDSGSGRSPGEGNGNPLQYSCLEKPMRSDQACDCLALTARTTWAKHACVCAKLLQPCLTLFDSMAYSLPGSSVYGILLARTLGWVAEPFSRRSSWPRDRTHTSCSSCTARGHFTAQPPGTPIWAKMDP